MNFFLFTLCILGFSFILRIFYFLQRKIFKKSYYSFFELITGIPQHLSFYQVFLIRFLPPFVIAFFAHQILNKYFNYSFLYYAFIGVIASLINIVPAIISIATYNGDNQEKINLKEKRSSIYVIYFFYFISFILLSGIGAYFSASNNINFVEYMPSKQGIVDALWILIIYALLSKLNKPL